MVSGFGGKSVSSLGAAACFPFTHSVAVTTVSFAALYQTIENMARGESKENTDNPGEDDPFL